MDIYCTYLLLFAADSPNYSKQLTEIAQALNRPITPVWVVSLLLASLGALAALATEPAKTWIKEQLDIHELRIQLIKALGPNQRVLELLLEAANVFTSNDASGRPYVQLLNINVSPELLNHLLETRKDLLYRSGDYALLLTIHGRFIDLKRAFHTISAADFSMETTEAQGYIGLVKDTYPILMAFVSTRLPQSSKLYKAILSQTEIKVKMMVEYVLRN